MNLIEDLDFYKFKASDFNSMPKYQSPEFLFNNWTNSCEQFYRTASIMQFGLIEQRLSIDSSRISPIMSHFWGLGEDKVWDQFILLG